MVFEERALLALEVYNSVLHNTETFVEDNIGADLAYLMGAILRGEQVDYFVDYFPRLYQLLYEMDPDHEVFEFINVINEF